MATITLKEGDFGSAEAVTVGEAALYLPDRARPGLNELVPLTAIIEIEDLAAARSGQPEEEARPSLRGLLTTVNPLGLAAGVFAVGKVKDVDFAVRLRDGRRFVAATDAVTLANLRAAYRTALVSASEDAEAAARADAVIARYVGPGALPLEPAPAAEAPSSDGAAPPAIPVEPPGPAPARAVFGRRGAR